MDKTNRCPDKYSEVKKEIQKIYEENEGRYGYRRITLALRNQKIILNHKTVRRLMNNLGLKCLVRMKKYRKYRGAIGKIAPNILNCTKLGIYNISPHFLRHLNKGFH